MTDSHKTAINFRTLIGNHVHNSVMLQDDDLYETLSSLNVIPPRVTLAFHDLNIPRGTKITQTSYAAAYLPFHKKITISLFNIAQPPKNGTNIPYLERRDNTVPHTTTLGPFSKYVCMPYRKGMTIYRKRYNEKTPRLLYRPDELQEKNAYHHPLEDGDSYYFLYDQNAL